MIAVNYPEGGLFPEWLWTLMSDLGLLVALVAFISALAWLWDRGPRLLIKYGPKWMTRLGTHWGNKRESKDVSK